MTMTTSRAPAKKTTPAKKTAPAKKTTPAKRAPAKKTAPAAEQAPPETAGTDTPAAATAVVEFRGRSINVVGPSPEQIAVYQLTADRFARLGDDMRAGKLDGVAAVKALARTIGIVKSVMADEHDREWIESELLDRRLTLQDVQPIVRDALDALAAAHGNREDRRRVRAAAARR